jgi:hypothetical protein
MDPESSILNSQNPTLGPYYEPPESNMYIDIIFLYDLSVSVIPPPYSWLAFWPIIKPKTALIWKQKF